MAVLHQPSRHCVLQKPQKACMCDEISIVFHDVAVTEVQVAATRQDMHNNPGASRKNTCGCFLPLPWSFAMHVF